MLQKQGFFSTLFYIELRLPTSNAFLRENMRQVHAAYYVVVIG